MFHNNAGSILDGKTMEDFSLNLPCITFTLS